jgi:HSP20 family protein
MPMKITKREQEPRFLSFFDPNRHVWSLRDAMNHLFDESFWDPFDRIPSMLAPVRSSVFPKVDVSETDGEVRVVANVPGVDPEKLDIQVGGDALTISGRVEREDEKREGKLYRYEREYGEFCREIPLPAPVKADAVSAKVTHGVLTIVLPKEEEAKKKKVKVEAE